MTLIYVVEDDENIREIETIALKNSNYEVEAFDNAKDFYKKLEEKIPDLVLLDIMLPDKDGYEIIRDLRKKEETRRLPVIMVTANQRKWIWSKAWTMAQMTILKNRFPLWSCFPE